MKLIVVSKYCDDSSIELVGALRANRIDADYLTPTQYENRVVGPHMLFAYGWSGSSHPKAVGRLNQRGPTRNCIDKVITFQKLDAANVPIPRFCVSKRMVPKEWDHVVVRQTRTGRKAEGFSIVYQPEQELPNGELYTEYFYHRYEYRVVVFNDDVFVYYKHREEEEFEFHTFKLKDSKDYPDMVRDARKAAKALNIDYVGFDVVAQNKRSYRFLEANSGPILTDEVKQAIVAYYQD